MKKDTDSDRKLRVAVTQWHATADMAGNLAMALGMVKEARSEGADLVLLPENGLMLGSNATMRAAAMSLDSPAIAALRAAAVTSKVAVIVGGFKRLANDGRVYNTALVIGAAGEIVGTYDKIHMFDANVGGQSFAASNVETAGSAPAVLMINGIKVGLTICYDVRFPELYRRLALEGAEVFVVPSAFTYTTGKAHWEILLRARAIENASYVVASATVRGIEGKDAFETYGHALVVDPWGEVLADLGDTRRGCKVVELSLGKVAQVRKSLPVLRGVKPQVYGSSLKTIALPNA